jgi:hypothetical protein
VLLRPGVSGVEVAAAPAVKVFANVLRSIFMSPPPALDYFALLRSFDAVAHFITGSPLHAVTPTTNGCVSPACRGAAMSRALYTRRHTRCGSRGLRSRCIGGRLRDALRIDVFVNARRCCRRRRSGAADAHRQP